MRTLRTKLKKFTDLPKTYEGLVALLPPRAIHDKTDASNAAEMMDVMAGHKLNADQTDYFELHCDLHEKWEADQEPAPTGTPEELLQLALEARQENPAALASFLGVDQSLGYRLVKGTRKLTAPQICKVAEHYGLSPLALLPK